MGKGRFKPSVPTKIPQTDMSKLKKKTLLQINFIFRIIIIYIDINNAFMKKLRSDPNAPPPGTGITRGVIILKNKHFFFNETKQFCKS